MFKVSNIEMRLITNFDRLKFKLGSPHCQERLRQPQPTKFQDLVQVVPRTKFLEHQPVRIVPSS